MCGGTPYGEVDGLVSLERWSCSRGASCVVERIPWGSSSNKPSLLIQLYALSIGAAMVQCNSHSKIQQVDC